MDERGPDDVRKIADLIQSKEFVNAEVVVNP